MEKNLNNLPEIIRSTYEFKEHDPATLSPLTLAFIGDTVFDLIVRTRVIENGNAPVNKLHKTASSLVNATTQSAIIRELIPQLDETELKMFKRGRNAKSYTSAKNANINDYRVATGFESLIGWLYLSGDMARIYELVLPVIPKYETKV